ncbi:Deoxyribonuclease-2-beta, partial [Orchesella cincta]
HISDKTSKNVRGTDSSETKDELEINQEDLIPEMINLTLADENEKLPNLIRDMKNLTLVDENEKFRISQEEPSCIFEPNVKNANMVKCVDNKNSQPEWDENGAECIENVYCRNNNSEKVDWYVAYRLPTNPRTNGKKRTGEQRLPNRFLFITPDGVERHFTSDAVENTIELLTNVHERPFIKYAVYNNEPPKYSNGTSYGNVQSSKGHVKGMLVYNTLHKRFFMQHTQPKFPPVQGFELKEASEYGQTYVCVTVSSAKNIRRIIRHISQLRPEIYATNIEQEIPAPIKNLPWNLLRISIHSENEQPFKLFSKTKADFDIYFIMN